MGVHATGGEDFWQESCGEFDARDLHKEHTTN